MHLAPLDESHRFGRRMTALPARVGLGVSGLVVFLIVCVVLLASLALLNGQPFFYWDTSTYIRGPNEVVRRLLGDAYGIDWARSMAGPDGTSPSLTSVEDQVVLAGRSVYYGALLLVGYLTSHFWLTLLLQALCVAFVLRTLIVDCLGLSARVGYAIVLVLAFATPLGYFTGLLMPDVFAGLVILVPAMLLVYGPTLGMTAKLALAGVLTLGLVSHSSHIVLTAALVVIAFVYALAFRPRTGFQPRAFGLVAACLGIAVLAEVAFSVGVALVLGQPPLRLPHLTARLVELRPGLEYLQEQCATAHFAVCAFAGRLPVPWTEFLFATNPERGVFAVADVATKRALSDEQIRFFLAVFRDAPGAVTLQLVKDVSTQLVRFELADIAYMPERWAYFEARLPASVLQSMQSSLAFGNRTLDQVLTALTYATTAAGLAILARHRARSAFSAKTSCPSGRAQGFASFISLALTGVVMNAAICAVLASPLHRFQARVIWIVPLLGLLALALELKSRAGNMLVARESQPSCPADFH